MIIQRQPDQIKTWAIVFFTKGTYRWSRFVPGRFKHVAAFGYSEPCRTWIVYDLALTRTDIYVLPDGQASVDRLSDWTRDASVLMMAVSSESQRVGRLGFWCVPAMKHLLGIRSGAVLPDQLWRSCLRNGAQIIVDGQFTSTSSCTDRA